MDLLSRLQSEFGDAVSCTAAVESDAVDGVQPQAVAAPRNEDAAQALVAWCGRENLAFVPRGGGTKLHIGAPPQRCDLIISTQHLSQIFDHDEGNATVQVGAGISLAVLGGEMRKHGQFVPIGNDEIVDFDTHCASLGGTVASNDFCGSKLKYGAPRDLVTGLHAVLSDGRLVKSGAKVVKNVAGYDLNKLFAGSFGTLGLITEVTIRLRPLSAHQVHAEWCVASYEEESEGRAWEPAAAQAWEIMNGPFEPTSLDVIWSTSCHAMRVHFDGGEAAVQSQKNKLPAHTDYLGFGDSPPILTCCSLRAQLPLQAAPRWAPLAEKDAVEVKWDCALGIVRAHFEEVPDIEFLRHAAEKLGGFLVVERAPSEIKTPELVWGAPRGDFALMQRLKQSFDAANVCAPGRFIGGL